MNKDGSLSYSIVSAGRLELSGTSTTFGTLWIILTELKAGNALSM